MNSDLHQALQTIDLDDPHAYAASRVRRCGWAGSDDEERSVTSAGDVVATALQLALEGTRVWDPAAVDLGGFLRGIIRSLVSTERKHYVRAKTVTSSERVMRHAGLTTSAEDVVVGAERDLEVEAMVEACIDGDDVLEKLWAAVLDGHTKREDLAEALRWHPAAVTAARIKLKRRIMQYAHERVAKLTPLRRPGRAASARRRGQCRGARVRLADPRRGLSRQRLVARVRMQTS